MQSYCYASVIELLLSDEGWENVLCMFRAGFFAGQCSKWHFIRTTLFLAAYRTWSPKNLCLSYLKRGHTSSNSSSKLCMTSSDEEMLQTEARKCCGYAPMRSSKIWFFVAQ